MRSPVLPLACTAVLLLAFDSAAPVSAGVLAHYNFDTDYRDSSGNGYHGVAFDGNYGDTLTSGDGDTDGVSITHTPGEWKFGGGAARFTEERDYVDIPTLSFADGQAYSLAFWAKKTLTGWDMFMGKPGTNIHTIGRQTNMFKWRGSSVANTHDFILSSDNDPTAWHHYVVIAGDFDDADTTVDEIRLYVDGQLIGTAAQTADTQKLDLQTGLILDTIGEAYWYSNNYDTEGLIDEVWIFDETLTDDQVASLYQANIVPEPSGLTLAFVSVLAFGFGMRQARWNRR